MRTIKIVVLVAGAWAFFATFSGNGCIAAEKIKELDASVDNLVEAENDTRLTAEAWNTEREDLLARVRELKSEARWLDFQVEKHQGYVRQREEEVAGLERDVEQAERLRRFLEPFLEETVDRLETFVQGDLPFLEGERKQRLASLREAMDDYRPGLGEKLRRVLEALVVEARYGINPEKSTETIELDGEPTQVELLRLGRVALYYLSFDGSRGGVMDPATRQWISLSRDDTESLSLAMEMADRRRVMELVDLPLPRRNRQ